MKRVKANLALGLVLGLATGLLVPTVTSVPGTWAAPAGSQTYSAPARSSLSNGQTCGRKSHIPCCKKTHAYSPANCFHTKKGKKTALPLPGGNAKKFQMIVKGKHGLDVVLTRVPNPLSRPKNAIAFSVSAVNSKTGKALTSFKPPFQLKSGVACLYNPATATCSAKTKFISKPGVYVVFR